MEDLFQYHIFVSVVHIEYGSNSNGNMLWHMKTQSHATPCQSSGNGKKTVCLCNFQSPAMLSVACILGGVMCTVCCVLCSVWAEARSTGIAAYLHNFNHLKRMRLLSFSRLCLRPTHKAYTPPKTQNIPSYFIVVAFFPSFPPVSFVVYKNGLISFRWFCIAACVVLVLLLLELLHKTLFDSQFSAFFVILGTIETTTMATATMVMKTVIKIYMPIWFWYGELLVFILSFSTYFQKYFVWMRWIRR